MTAGLQNAKGDAVIIMDVDLQEPPELIGQMIAVGVKVMTWSMVGVCVVIATAPSSA